MQDKMGAVSGETMSIRISSMTLAMLLLSISGCGDGVWGDCFEDHFRGSVLVEPAELPADGSRAAIMLDLEYRSCETGEWELCEGCDLHIKSTRNTVPPKYDEISQPPLSNAAGQTVGYISSLSPGESALRFIEYSGEVFDIKFGFQEELLIGHVTFY